MTFEVQIHDDTGCACDLTAEDPNMRGMFQTRANFSVVWTCLKNFSWSALFRNDDFSMKPQSRAVENDVLLNNVDKNGVNINDNGSVNFDRNLNLVGGAGASASALRLG
jgi:hypothetical protein